MVENVVLLAGDAAHSHGTKVRISSLLWFFVSHAARAVPRVVQERMQSPPKDLLAGGRGTPQPTPRVPRMHSTGAKATLFWPRRRLCARGKAVSLRRCRCLASLQLAGSRRTRRQPALPQVFWATRCFGSEVRIFCLSVQTWS